MKRRDRSRWFAKGTSQIAIIPAEWRGLFVPSLLVFGLQAGILTAGCEARTRLGDMGQLTVSEDMGAGIVAMKRLQQLEHGMLLGWRAGVDFFTLGIDATLVADADGTAVVAPGMNATYGLGQNGNDVAIATDIPVVTGLAEAGFARSNQILDGVVAVATRGRAVDDEEFDILLLEWC